MMSINDAAIQQEIACATGRLVRAVLTWHAIEFEGNVIPGHVGDPTNAMVAEIENYRALTGQTGASAR